MKNWLNLAKERVRETLPWAIGAIFAVSAGWAGDGVKELIDSGLNAQPLPALKHATIVIYIAIFIFAAWGMAWVARQYFSPRTRFMNNIESPEKREHLVLFLSDLDIARGGYRDGVPEALALSGDLDADIKRLEDLKATQRLMWRWEMPLRAIWHHIGKLKTITLICSHESLPQVPWFCKILHGYGALRDVTVWVYGKEDHRPCLNDE